MNWLLAALAAIAAALVPGACSEDADPTPRVPALVIGDSLTVGARDFGDLPDQAAELGLDLEIVAIEGRATSWGIEEVEQMDHVPPVVVVALGTNPGVDLGEFASEAPRLVEELEERGARQVVWVPPVTPDPAAYAEHRDVLASIASDQTGVHVTQWPDELWAHPEWFAADGLHLTEAGYGALAQQIVVGILESGGRLAA